MALYDAVELTVISTVILIVKHKRELTDQITGAV